jgi:type VI secretion system protein ImpC
MSQRFEFGFGNSGDPGGRKDAAGTMRLLVMADFSGWSNESGDRPIMPGDRPRLRTDFENFDAILSRLNPTIRIPLYGPWGDRLSVNFSEVDDFHPDSLYNRLEPFKTLRDLRARLMNPDSFRQAAAQIMPAAGATETETPAKDEVAVEKDAATFERLLGRGPSAEEAPGDLTARQQNGVQGFIQSVMQPYVVAEADPRQPELVASVDQAISDQMRLILHSPGFQAMEATWRSLQQLVTELETGVTVEVRILDVTKEELAAEFQASPDIASGSLYRSLVEEETQSLGGQGQSLLVGNYTFSRETEDILLLASLGTLAGKTGGPFLAGASSSILGCGAIHETPDPREWIEDPQADLRWQALRSNPAAPWVGLAMPRVLLRLPYGEKTDEVERFAFEEFPAGIEHESLLWGNPAFLCARLIGEAFQENEWSGGPVASLDIGELPAYIVTEDGDRRMHPCAEILLHDRAAQAIQDKGIMPLLSYRDRNAVRLFRLHPVVAPLTTMPGPWDQGQSR